MGWVSTGKAPAKGRSRAERSATESIALGLMKFYKYGTSCIKLWLRLNDSGTGVCMYGDNDRVVANDWLTSKL